ncbi:mitochondrial translocase subunit [Trypanosoma grayi]|uniref:mitochondrial translocase subunit n=1 Tax=Trypanosoma grayi TaxID=71804 RepID=UPI0004F448E1|nr:mitochondrial translocase subunit [Trypanosoma grayi]KEG07452.1 mitochondrial translocase subunit [Trypanosoma grayi]
MAHTSAAWNEEFEVQKRMQEDRMNFANSMTCHERCVSHYWLNNFYAGEYRCMKNCLEKLNQVGVITNINLTKYEQEKATQKRK